MLIINIPDSKTKTQRSFVVSEYFYPTVKKYMSILRANHENNNRLSFFRKYSNGKCTKQNVGINTLGNVPSQIATYLGLPDAKTYTGHCFRRTSATILVDAGGDLLDLKRHGGWQSSAVAEGYVDNSMSSKAKNSTKITSAIAGNSKDSTTSNNNVTVSYASMQKSNDTPFVFNNCTVTINNYNSN